MELMTTLSLTSSYNKNEQNKGRAKLDVYKPPLSLETIKDRIMIPSIDTIGHIPSYAKLVNNIFIS